MAMKINAMINVIHSQSNKSNYIRTMLMLFPNIQTIQLPDFNYLSYENFPQQLTFIRCFNQPLLKDFIIPDDDDDGDDFMYFFFDNTVLDVARFFIHETGGMYLDKYTPRDFAYVPTEIVSKMEQYEILSNETLMFFYSHLKEFTSLKKLFMFNKKPSSLFENDYIMEILSVLHIIQSIQTVCVHSKSLPTNTKFFSFFNKYPMIKFVFILYDFGEQQLKTYQHLHDLSNVEIMFSCPSMNLYKYKFYITDYGLSQLKKSRNQVFQSDLSISSIHFDNFCSVLHSSDIHLNEFKCEKFDMNSPHNLSNISINRIFLKFIHIVPEEFVMPKTLRNVELIIDINYVNPKKTPHLILDATDLNVLKLIGFKYDTIEQLNLKHSPIEILLENCSNISISSSGSSIISELKISECNHININTTSSTFTNVNDIIVSNIEYVTIIEKNCLNYSFDNVTELNLSTISPFINIKFPNTLKILTFEIVPNTNNIKLPLKDDVINSVKSIEELQLTNFTLKSFREEINLILQQTIKEISLYDCKNVHIKTLKKRVISSFDYQRSGDCYFKNIEIPKISNSLQKRVRGCGIIL
ncbi:Uncharacterized protein QTN25_004239 [Entamoeba marina]